MTNEDQIAALFAKANPVPSLDLFDPVESLDMDRLERQSERSRGMTDLKTDQMRGKVPGRWPRLALVLAVPVIAVVALVILLNRDSVLPVAAPPTTTASAPPTTTAAAPSTTTTPPAALRSGPLSAGTYMVTPFAPPDEEGVCMTPPQAGCSELPSDDSIRITFTVPDGWSGAPLKSIWLTARANSAPEGAGLIFNRGGWLHSDPCRNDAANPDVAVGPSVDDFANALADHPLLEVTTPVDVTLGGYSGKYLDLQTPSDIPGCQYYFAWEPALYAQGPSQRWHLWILDVDGVRVVVESTDYPGTSAEDRAELQAIVDSIQIEP